jgi:hypothetical protein
MAANEEYRGLYHGSPRADVKELKPQLHKLLDKPGIFATDIKNLALAMSVPSNDQELASGFKGDDFYVDELEPGKLSLLDKPSTLYELPGDTFSEQGAHPDLMQQERISNVSVKPTRAIAIANVLQALRDGGATIRAYDDIPEEFHGNKQGADKGMDTNKKKRRGYHGIEHPKQRLPAGRGRKTTSCKVKMNSKSSADIKIQHSKGFQKVEDEKHKPKKIKESTASQEKRAFHPALRRLLTGLLKGRSHLGKGDALLESTLRKLPTYQVHLQNLVDKANRVSRKAMQRAQRAGSDDVTSIGWNAEAPVSRLIDKNVGKITSMQRKTQQLSRAGYKNPFPGALVPLSPKPGGGKLPQFGKFGMDGGVSQAGSTSENVATAEMSGPPGGPTSSLSSGGGIPAMGGITQMASDRFVKMSSAGQAHVLGSHQIGFFQKAAMLRAKPMTKEARLKVLHYLWDSQTQLEKEAGLEQLYKIFPALAKGLMQGARATGGGIARGARAAGSGIARGVRTALPEGSSAASRLAGRATTGLGRMRQLQHPGTRRIVEAMRNAARSRANVAAKSAPSKGVGGFRETVVPNPLLKSLPAPRSAAGNAAKAAPKPPSTPPSTPTNPNSVTPGQSLVPAKPPVKAPGTGGSKPRVPPKEQGAAVNRASRQKLDYNPRGLETASPQSKAFTSASAADDSLKAALGKSNSSLRYKSQGGGVAGSSQSLHGSQTVQRGGLGSGGASEPIRLPFSQDRIAQQAAAGVPYTTAWPPVG